MLLDLARFAAIGGVVHVTQLDRTVYLDDDDIYLCVGC